MNNYNTFVGICVGLNNVSLMRLKKTDAFFQRNYAKESEVLYCTHSACLTLKQYEELLKVQDPTGNYKTLRTMAANAGSQIIPYMYEMLSFSFMFSIPVVPRALIWLSSKMAIVTWWMDSSISRSLKCSRRQWKGSCSTTQSTTKSVQFFFCSSSVPSFLVSRLGHVVPPEPLYSLLKVFPQLGKDDLYNLSLLREPKELG